VKKSAFLILILVFTTSLGIFAQVDKGRFFISGSSQLGINFGTEKQKYNGDPVEGYKNTFSNFNFQPGVGYVFVNQLVAGIFVDIESYSEKTKDGSLQQDYRGTTLIAGPMVRYYFDLGDKLEPYVSAGIGYGFDHSKSRYDDDSDWSKFNEVVFGFNTGIGATFFFNKMIGLDGFLGFQHETYTSKVDPDDASRDSIKNKFIYNELIGTIGIVVLLGN